MQPAWDNALIVSFYQCDRATKSPVCAEICTPLAKPVIPALIFFLFKPSAQTWWEWIGNCTLNFVFCLTSIFDQRLKRMVWGKLMASSTDDVKGQFVIQTSLHFLGHNNKIPPVFPAITSRRTSKVQIYFPNLGCCCHSFLDLLSPFIQLQKISKLWPQNGWSRCKTQCRDVSVPLLTAAPPGIPSDTIL